MSNYPNQQKGRATQSDELGNPIQHGSTGTNAAGGYNAGGTEFGNTKPTGGHGTKAAGHGQTDQLRRSGSGSSSSSEDDGQGGRRKKGLKDKIKEKLPGGHKEEQHQQGQYPSSGATTTPVGGVGYDQSGQQLHEKKGMVDKIKDKLPGAGTH